MKIILTISLFALSVIANAASFDVSSEVPYRMCGADLPGPTECVNSATQAESMCDNSQKAGQQNLTENCNAIGGALDQLYSGRPQIKGSLKLKTLTCSVFMRAVCKTN